MALSRAQFYVLQAHREYNEMLDRVQQLEARIDALLRKGITTYRFMYKGEESDQVIAEIIAKYKVAGYPEVTYSNKNYHPGELKFKLESFD